MPYSSLKPCSYPGCNQLVRSGYCAAHQHTERRVGNAEMDANSKRMYNSVRWQRMRRLQLSTQPWCEECLKEDVYTPATDADHIEPHRGDPHLFYYGKLQSLCHPHHSAKTMKEVQGRGTENV